MQHHAVAAPEGLRDVIQSFWYTALTAEELAAGFEIIPDGYAEIIFYVGSPCHVATPEGWQPLPSPFLVGLLNQPLTLTAASRLEVIGIKCFPWTVFDLLGLPAGNDGVRIIAHPIAQLQATLAAYLLAGDIAGALAQVQHYFVATPWRPVAGSLLGKAGAALRAAQGKLPVSQVAAAAHATVRTLERNFKQAAGHTVKDVAGLMRFEQVRNRLWQQPEASLAGLAQELGYTDQAHLSREFKRYSGTTPAAFARQARRGHRALPRDFVAFVQA